MNRTDPILPATPAETMQIIEAAEAASLIMVSEGAELLAAGGLKIGVAYLRSEEAYKLAAFARKRWKDFPGREWRLPDAIGQAVREALDRSYPRNPRELENPWGETIKVPVAVRDCEPERA